jgi:hypothetical protein
MEAAFRSLAPPMPRAPSSHGKAAKVPASPFRLTARRLISPHSRLVVSGALLPHSRANWVVHDGDFAGIADRVHIMVDISDDTKIIRRRAEVTGVVRRRRWSDEEKGRIVAEGHSTVRAPDRDCRSWREPWTRGATSPSMTMFARAAATRSRCRGPPWTSLLKRSSSEEYQGRCGHAQILWGWYI